jgi:hypothetical protein
MGGGEVLPVGQLGFKRGMAGRDALGVDGYNLGPVFFGERVDANGHIVAEICRLESFDLDALSGSWR